MILELMSNGTLAKLPPSSLPSGISLPDGPFVLALLPHNRYLLGCPAGTEDRWVWGKPGETPQEIFLYDDEDLALPREGAAPILLPRKAVLSLKQELFSQMTPPGDHKAAVLTLRSLMRDRPVFLDGTDFQDEAVFLRRLREDDLLRKGYWTLRFALARGEMDVVTRLKAWLKAGPGLLSPRGDAPGEGPRVWFSILETPGDDALEELEALAFSRDDLQRMVAQRVLPLILFNTRSGYLVLDRAGKNEGTGFFVWAFLPPALWAELRERRKLTVHEIILALWGERDVETALRERARYAA